MFGTLTTAYLFLGGAGAGALALASLVDLVWLKQPFGVMARVSLDEALPAERLVAFTLLAGFAAVVACCVSCLTSVASTVSMCCWRTPRPRSSR